MQVRADMKDSSAQILQKYTKYSMQTYQQSSKAKEYV